MVYGCAHPPCGQYLEGENTESGFPAIQFPVNGGNGRRAGNIQKAEYHQCICVCRAETDGIQRGDHGAHAVGGRDVLDTEQDAAAGYDNLFCRNARDQCNDDLPISQSGRLE